MIRILISSAVALRILLDQHPTEFEKTPMQPCGSLWPSWPKNKRRPEVLTLREACNKIVHSEDIKDDDCLAMTRTLGRPRAAGASRIGASEAFTLTSGPRKTGLARE